jgi:hypothetical protein
VARKGRVESALDRDLLGHDQIGAAERAALRAQARAVDMGEAADDGYLLTTANRVYLELRSAAGLTAGSAPPADAFGDLLAELAKPTAGVRDTPDV